LINIINNGDQLDSFKLSETFSTYNFIKVSESNNYGFSHANNIGINFFLSIGVDYICLINNDAIVESNIFDRCIEILSSPDNKIGLVTSYIKYFDKNQYWYYGQKFNLALTRLSTSKNKTNFSNFASGCFMFIPSYIFKSIGLLRESYFMYYEDADFSLRIIRFGYKIFVISDQYILHKVNSSVSKIKNKVFYNVYYSNRNRLLLIYNEYNNKFIRYFSFFILFFEITLKIILNFFIFNFKKILVYFKSIFDYFLLIKKI
jgi:GT2 family glycosyltransferase